MDARMPFGILCAALLKADRRGATLVEFAMIASVLFLMICGILALGVDQFEQVVLDDSLRRAVREIQVRQITSATLTQAAPGALVDAVCSELGIVAGNCASLLQYSVQAGASFAALTPATLTGAGVFTGGNRIDAFAPGQDLFVQVAIREPVALPFLSAVLSGNGTPALVSAAALKIEP